MSSEPSRQSHRLILLGVSLFLIGLLTGLGVANFAIPRLGLAAHLEGLLNGMFLALLGLIWPRVALGPTGARVAFWLVVYAAFALWLATILAALWGAGSALMPFAAAGLTGSPVQEAIIKFLILSLSAAMIAGVGMILWGVWRGGGKIAG
jgi:hydroxylaminobenzene mutase